MRERTMNLVELQAHPLDDPTHRDENAYGECGRDEPEGFRGPQADAREGEERLARLVLEDNAHARHHHEPRRDEQTGRCPCLPPPGRSARAPDDAVYPFLQRRAHEIEEQGAREHDAETDGEMPAVRVRKNARDLRVNAAREIAAQIEGEPAPDLEYAGRDLGAQRGLAHPRGPGAPGARRLQRALRGEEHGGLVGVAKRRDVSLETRIEHEAEARGDHQVASPRVLGGMEHAGVEVGGEEHRLGKLSPERPEDQRFVIDVAAEHADGLDLIGGAAVGGIGRELANMRGEPSEVVDLRGTFRTLEGLEGARAVRLYLLAVAP
jgi:hypothetical protein